MFPITTKITQDVTEYNTGQRPVTITSFIGNTFWYIFVFMLIGMVCIWALYSISNSHQKSKITDYLVNSIKQIRAYFTKHPKTNHPKSHPISSESSIPSTSSIISNTSSHVTSSGQLVYNPNDIHETSHVEQSTQAINTALNYNAPIIDHPDGAFTNDDPDSTIQSGRNSRMSLLGWSISNELGVSEHAPLQHAYISSSSSV